MHAWIIANGQINNQIQPAAGDLVIAADGGARHCLATGLSPAYVIGDLDSLGEPDLERLRSLGAQILQYPPAKDFTDLELALKLAIDLGADEIIIAAALGSRWDQSLANLLLPTYFPGATIRLIDGAHEIRLLHGGETLFLQGNPGDTVSLLALSPFARGITTDGLEYPLHAEALQLGSTRGISNVLRTGQASVFLKEGLLLCIHIHSQNGGFSRMP